MVSTKSRSANQGRQEPFEFLLARMASTSPELAQACEAVRRDLRAAQRAPLFSGDGTWPVGRSDLGLYLHVRRDPDGATSWAFLCEAHATASEGEQRRRGLRPAQPTDFQYAVSAPPACVVCGQVFDGGVR